LDSRVETRNSETRSSLPMAEDAARRSRERLIDDCLVCAMMLSQFRKGLSNSGFRPDNQL